MAPLKKAQEAITELASNVEDIFSPYPQLSTPINYNKTALYNNYDARPPELFLN